MTNKKNIAFRGYMKAAITGLTSQISVCDLDDMTEEERRADAATIAMQAEKIATFAMHREKMNHENGSTVTAGT